MLLALHVILNYVKSKLTTRHHTDTTARCQKKFDRHSLTFTDWMSIHAFSTNFTRLKRRKYFSIYHKRSAKNTTRSYSITRYVQYLYTSEKRLIMTDLIKLIQYPQW